MIEHLNETPTIHLELLARIKQIIVDMRLLPAPPDTEIADVLGEVRHLETMLGDWRRSLLVETPKVEGDNYKVEETRKATRSYNTAGILIAAAHGRPLDETILELRDQDVVRLQWQWSKLNRYFADHRLELRVAKGFEIPDDGNLDGPHVGEVWETTTRLVPKEER